MFEHSSYLFGEGKKICLPTGFPFGEGNCPFCLNVDPPLEANLIFSPQGR